MGEDGQETLWAQLPPNPSSFENQELKVTVTDNDLNIQRKDKSLWGNYCWWVVTKDMAGNTTASEKQFLHIGTTASNFSKTFFPLTLETKPSTINNNANNKQPFSFWGIAPYGTKVRLTIKKYFNTTINNNEALKQLNNDNIIFDSITTANPDSIWGINIPSGLLKPGAYTVQISSANPAGDYQQLKPFNLVL